MQGNELENRVLIMNELLGKTCRQTLFTVHKTKILLVRKGLCISYQLVLHEDVHFHFVWKENREEKGLNVVNTLESPTHTKREKHF